MIKITGYIEKNGVSYKNSVIKAKVEVIDNDGILMVNIRANILAAGSLNEIKDWIDYENVPSSTFENAKGVNEFYEAAETYINSQLNECFDDITTAII